MASVLGWVRIFRNPLGVGGLSFAPSLNLSHRERRLNAKKAVVSRRRTGVSSGDMIDEKLLGRITANPEIFGGKPIIRGMRISVEMILSLLAQGEKEETILADYPDLEPDDLRACLAYAHAAISHDN